MNQHPGPDPAHALEEEFSRLEQRAILAVVARTARRVLPVLVTEEGDLAHGWAVDGAIRMAEGCASGHYVTRADVEGAERVLNAGRPDDLWAEWSPTQHPAHVRASAGFLALATRFTVEASAEADRTQRGKKMRRASSVAVLEGLAALEQHSQDRQRAEKLFRNESDRLTTVSDRAFLRQGDPIDPGEEGPLGPLWPQGAPTWWHPWGDPSFRPGEVFLPSDVFDEAPSPPGSSQPEMFVADARVAKLALRCLDPTRAAAGADLRVSSRRFVLPDQAPEAGLDVVREAIGERLVRLISSLARDASVRPDAPEPVLILRDRRQFAEDVQQGLIQRLALVPTAAALADFQAALASDFWNWLKAYPEVQSRMSGEFDGEQFSVRCPAPHDRSRRR